MIDVRNVKQSFGKKVILQDVNFSIGEGEIVGLLGPSGSGKTTLIKTLIGMILPTKRSNDVLGIIQTSIKPISHICYMAQSDVLYVELTAKEILANFGRIYGLKRKNLQNRIQVFLS